MPVPHKDDFKVAFLQTGDIPYIGIMSIAAVLKKNGFSTNVFSIDLENDVVKSILRSNPDMIACSAMTPTFKTIMRTIIAVKQKNPKIFVVIGGPHVTFSPDAFNQEKNLDGICLGEGEYPMLELASSLRNGELRTDIKNFWFRNKGDIVKNELRDLIKDLDSLPFPDRELYYKRYPFMAKRTIRFIMSRGCPFDCSYCTNKSSKDLYKGKGKFVRFRSIKSSIEEIKMANTQHPIKWLSFMDDTFNIDKKRFRNFLEIYKREIKIPFICQLRVDLADEDQIELLKQAGVDKINIGIEHGDEEFRKKVLNRSMSNRQILDFACWVNKRKIRLNTQNIIGFPGETVDLAFSTIDLNAKIKPETAICSILNPYPGTNIFKYARTNGCLIDDFDFNNLVGHSNWYLDSSSRIRSAIKNEDMPKLINLRCFFMTLVMYSWLKPLVRLLIKLPYNPLYEFIWQITGNVRASWKFADPAEKKAIVKRLMHVFKS